MNCWHCGAEIETRERVGFRDYCPKCDRAEHCCRNCEFYDRNYNNECREPTADRVVDKERFNFCEYFAAVRERRVSSASSGSDPRQKLEALFKKKS
jgi:hypothetical protein